MHIPFHQRLVGRLILFGIGPMLVLVVLQLTIGMLDKARTLQSIAESSLLQAAQLATSQAEDRLNNTLHVATAVAEAEASGVLADAARRDRFLELVARQNASVRSVWITWDDAAGRPHGARATLAESTSGRATLDADPTIGRGEIYERLARAVRDGRSADPVVGQPVEVEGEQVVRTCVPIVADGAFRGVAGVDTNLTASGLERAVAALASGSGLDVFVVAGDGTLVAANGPTFSSDSRLRGQAVTKTERAGLLAVPLAGAKSAGPQDIEQAVMFESDDSGTGRRFFVAVGQTRTGGWKLAIAKPVAAVTAPVKAEVARNAGIALLGIVVVTGAVVWLALRVSRRIDRAVRVAQQIASGDLSVRLDAEGGPDESGVLLRVFASMIERLHALIGKVSEAGQTLDRSVRELARNTQTQRDAAMPLGPATSEVAAAAKQISTTSSELAKTMDGVRTSAEESAALATASRSNLAQVDGAMRELEGATASVASKLGAINEKAVAINTVIETITKVADQTNLLSVNAAIEAEKAGEQGRGFLVVAREIRRLADQTAAATSDIEHMVEEMQAAVSAGVMEMDRFAEKVRRSVDEVADSSRRMGEIIERVAENSERFHAVSGGVTSQSQGAAQISEAATRLQTSARSAVDGIARLVGTARTLESASATLRSEVAAFRLGDPA